MTPRILRQGGEGDMGGASGGALKHSLDEATFDALVRAHYGRLCNFAVRFVKTRDIAEDLVQDVFLRIWQRQTEFQYEDPLPYLYQAVRNRAANYARDQQVRLRWWDAAAYEAETTRPGAARRDAAEQAELGSAIARAVDALPNRCRQIFTMSREQDLTYTQIARALGVSVKTVETQMGRALKLLRSKLAPYR